jgi:hypothetical protein
VSTSVKIPVSLRCLLEYQNRLSNNPHVVHDAVLDLEAHVLRRLLDLNEEFPGGLSNPLMDLDNLPVLYN